jgi:hypothetical protein
MRPGLALVLLLALGSHAPAEETASAWQQQKCSLYEKAWGRAIDQVGSDDLNYNFIAMNENFIASGCRDNSRACPQSIEEIEIANLLSIVMMNEGMASTFLPFGCASQ